MTTRTPPPGGDPRLDSDFQRRQRQLGDRGPSRIPRASREYDLGPSPFDPDNHLVIRTLSTRRYLICHIHLGKARILLQVEGLEDAEELLAEQLALSPIRHLWLVDQKTGIIAHHGGRE